MKKQLNLIQVSRALVPILVILFHANEWMVTYFNKNILGFTVDFKSGGVYYFFALSGFMVYYLYSKKFGSPSVIKEFLYSRFIRVYPIYWILTIATLLVYFLIPSFGNGTEREISRIITSLLLLPIEIVPILSVAWSLVHTVFFYLMFTLFFLKNKMISNAIFFIWVAISIIFSLGLLTSSSYFINFLFNFNNLIFFFGMVSAYVILKININYYVSLLFVVLGISGFPLSWFNTQYEWISINLQITTSLSSVLLIIGLASIDLQNEIKIPRFAKYLGDASFSIYLTHFLSLSLISKVISSISLISVHYMITINLLIIFSLIIGCIVYSFLEKPVNKKLKNLYLRRQPYAPPSKLLTVSNTDFNRNSNNRSSF